MIVTRSGVGTTTGCAAGWRKSILLRLAQQQGLPLIVPFLNKCDLAVNTPLSDDLEEHVEALLGAYGFTPITPIWGAAWPALGNHASPWHECLEQLLLHLDYSVPLSF